LIGFPEAAQPTQHLHRNTSLSDPPIPAPRIPATLPLNSERQLTPVWDLPTVGQAHLDDHLDVMVAGKARPKRVVQPKPAGRDQAVDHPITATPHP
jgi:hypothetical protein